MPSEGKAPAPFTGNEGRAGQLVYSRIWCRRGAIALITEELDGVVVTSEFPIFDIDESRVDRRFLLRYLLTHRFLDELDRVSRGANGQQRVREASFLSLTIPLPPLFEQRRIADILDKAEALRTKRRETISYLDALSRSIFYEMFADSQEWPVSKLELLAIPKKGSIRTGPFGSQLLTSEFTTDGIAVLGIDNTVGNSFSWKERRFISEEKYEQLKRYTVYPGDLIITIMGTLGRCAVVPDDIPRAINTKHLCCITLDQRQADPAYIHAYFLHHSMAARHLRQTTKGSIMAGLNMGIIKAMPVVVPPVELQNKFANRVAAVESLKNAHRAQLGKHDNLFLSLQDRAFKGEL